MSDKFLYVLMIFYSYIITACTTVKLLARQFSDLILTCVQTCISNIGIDLHREER